MQIYSEKDCPPDATDSYEVKMVVSKTDGFIETIEVVYFARNKNAHDQVAKRAAEDYKDTLKRIISVKYQ